MQSASDLAAARYSGCTRRGFLGAAAAASLTFSLPRSLVAVTRRLERPVRIGLIADLHHDVMHDGFSRMEAFVHEMQVRRPDAIMQLGDFAYPNTKNRRVIDLFNQAHKTSLHVIGNHDTDAGHSKQQCLDVWEVPGRYYMTTVGGIQFLVLDGNDAGSPTYQGGYPSYVGKEQINWLKEQLTSLDGPIIVACHQPLAGAWAVDNAREIQAILSAASDKVLLALNGHSHIDDAVRVDGVTYLHINSASYQWVGGDFQHESYPKQVHAQYPSIKYVCPYRDSLFATLTVDPETLEVRVAGRQSEWVGKSPAALGKDLDPNLINGEEVSPRIRNRLFERIAV